MHCIEDLNHYWNVLWLNVVNVYFETLSMGRLKIIQRTLTITAYLLRRLGNAEIEIAVVRIRYNIINLTSKLLTVI